MNYKGVLKRLLPFAATFFVAVFITSFFVDISASRFANWRAHRWERRCGFERMMRESEELRNENLRLRNELQNNRIDVDDIPNAIPALPVPPPAPAIPRMKVKILHDN
jgi:hypothetical protein